MDKYKERIDQLRKEGLIFTRTETIDTKAVGIKKRVDILKCVDANGFYHFLLFINAKSRFLQKNSAEVGDLYKKTVQFCGHNFKFKRIFIENGLCSKAKERLKEDGWRVYNG